MKKEIQEKLVKARKGGFNSKELGAVVVIEGELMGGARRYMGHRQFVEVQVPHITRVSGACENIQTLFETDFFGNDAYLSQTGQLYLEAFVSRFSRVSCIGPSFRSEPTVDTRHLVEFPLIEMEHTGGMAALQARIEGIIGAMVNQTLDWAEKELNTLGVNQKELEKLLPPFTTITYRRAVEALEDMGVKWGDDLKSQHEAYLIARNDGKPLYVTHYPAHIKFFNMRVNRKDERIVNSGDLLLPYSGEAVGSAEREEDVSILERRLRESDMMRLMKERLSTRPEFAGGDYQQLEGEVMNRFRWYLDLIKEDPIKHAGCGIGFNRVAQAVLQATDIRAVTAYPLNKETIL